VTGEASRPPWFSLLTVFIGSNKRDFLQAGISSHHLQLTFLTFLSHFIRAFVTLKRITAAMDFINKFKHGDDSEHEQKRNDTDNATRTSPAPETSHNSTDNNSAEEHEPKRDFLGKLIGGSGHHHKRDSDDKDGDDKGFFGKHLSKEEREKKNLELEKRELELNFELEHVLKEQKDNQGFFDRLKDKFDGDLDKEKVLEHPPKDDEGDKPSFFDKLTGKEEREKKAVELERREAEIRAELEKVKHDKKENQDLLERIKDRLDGETDDEDEGRAAAAKKKEKSSFLDKITGKAEEEERRRKEEEEKNAFQKLGDRINEGLGGGRKAEEKEDFLDKSKQGSTTQYLLQKQRKKKRTILSD
jgi:hypothetical protein